jgi:hypothetical protein
VKKAGLVRVWIPLVVILGSVATGSLYAWRGIVQIPRERERVRALWADVTGAMEGESERWKRLASTQPDKLSELEPPHFDAIANRHGYESIEEVPFSQSGYTPGTQGGALMMAVAMFALAGCMLLVARQSARSKAADSADKDPGA